MIERLNHIIGSVIEEIYLRVWPPEWEPRWSNSDVALVMVLSKRSTPQCCIFSTSKDDAWTQVVEVCSANEFVGQEIRHDFNRRIADWRVGRVDDVVDFEMYDVTADSNWSSFRGAHIDDIRLLIVEDGAGSGSGSGSLDWNDVFGIEIETGVGRIRSHSGAHGNVLSTPWFNTDDEIAHFRHLGEVRVHSLVSG